MTDDQRDLSLHPQSRLFCLRGTTEIKYFSLSFVFFIKTFRKEKGQDERQRYLYLDQWSVIQLPTLPTYNKKQEKRYLLCGTKDKQGKQLLFHDSNTSEGPVCDSILTPVHPFLRDRKSSSWKKKE